MSRASNALIQQLLAAEEEAEKIVARARENRVRKLKEALVSAQNEVEVFKSREEAQFEREFNERYGHEDTTNTDLAAVTQKEIDLVKRDYKANRDSVVSFLLKNTTAVNMELTGGQRRYIEEVSRGHQAVYK